MSKQNLDIIGDADTTNNSASTDTDATQIDNTINISTQPSTDTDKATSSAEVVSAVPPKKSPLFTIKTGLYTVFSALARALAVQLFLIPNSIVLGGATGIASLIEIKLYSVSPIFSACYFLIFINIPLLIIAFFKVGKRWTIRTTINVLLTSIFLWLIKFFDLARLLNTTNSEQTVLFVLMGGVLSGLALPMMLNAHGSTGGSDIIALLIRKKNSVTTIRNILYMDIAVSALSAVVLMSFNVFVFSMMALFASEVIGEIMYKGYSSAMVLEIVTDKPQEVSHALMYDLKHGVTNIKIRGTYTNSEKMLVICVIYKRQINAAKQLIREVDNKAFAYVLNVKEVVGLGFRNKEEELISKD
ncbi:MAG: YitT family protein [Clostridia bacterium]